MEMLTHCPEQQQTHRSVAGEEGWNVEGQGSSLKHKHSISLVIVIDNLELFIY